VQQILASAPIRELSYASNHIISPRGDLQLVNHMCYYALTGSGATIVRDKIGSAPKGLLLRDAITLETPKIQRRR
jgi:hypothetical protein